MYKKIKWIERQTSLGNQIIWDGFVGIIRLFSYRWLCGTGKDNDKPYILYTHLNGIKDFRLADEKEIQTKATLILRYIYLELKEN